MIPRSTHRQLLPLPSARQFLMLHHRMIILSIFHLQITVHRVFIPAGHIFRKLASSMPEPAFALFQKEITSGRLMDADDFSSILGYRVLSCSKKELENIYDMTPEIANRIIKNRYHFSSFTQFCAQNQEPRYHLHTHEPDPSASDPSDDPDGCEAI